MRRPSAGTLSGGDSRFAQNGPTVSLVIPAYNAEAELRLCLEAIASSTVQPLECIVVDDGSTDGTVGVAREYNATLLSTGGRRSSAYARNVGLNAARGSVILFVDADVCVHADTIERVRARFAGDPKLDALIGSYDEAPGCPDVLSQYRNLMHCYTHQTSSRQAATFWSGCGAAKRSVLVANGGFDASYGNAMEDVELGYRMAANGAVIELDPEIRCKHLKRWTFTSLVRTDVFSRGVPWTLMILRAGRMPNDLNLRWHHRASVALTGTLVLLSMFAVALHGGEFLTPLLGAVLVVLASYWVIEALGNNGGLVRIALGCSLTALVVLAFITGHEELIATVLIAYVWMFLREALTRGRPRLRRWSGLLYGGYVACVLGALVSSMPAEPAVGAFLFLLCLVLSLNLRFYRFLFSRIGNLAGMSSVPFHLLYHLYSGVSFVIGAVQFHQSRLARQGRR